MRQLASASFNYQYLSTVEEKYFKLNSVESSIVKLDWRELMSKDREYKQIVKTIVVLFVCSCRSNITIEQQIVMNKSYKAKSLYT